MPTLTEFCKINVTLRFTPIGRTGTGMRVDVPFDGVATSSHWDGDRPVTGTDYVTVGADGVQHLEIRARIGTGRDVVSYQALGRGTTETGPKEVLVFETANEAMSFLNSAIGVALGDLEGDQLSLTVSLIAS